MKRICIVDDDEAVRDSLSLFLEACGYGVVAFASALAFLNTVDLGPLACYLIDMHMPGMSGLELAELLRGRAVETPIFIITAAVDPLLRVQGAKLPALAFLEKPVEGETLLDAIEMTGSGQTA